MRAEGQYSWSPLLSSEQFSYGGQLFGRAYDSSEIVGDHGISEMLELRYHVLPHSIQLLTFYDVGKIWNIKNQLNKDRSASSIGVGLRANYKDALNASLMLAHPITKKISTPLYGNGKNPKILFMLNYKF